MEYILVDLLAISYHVMYAAVTVENEAPETFQRVGSKSGKLHESSHTNIIIHGTIELRPRFVSTYGTIQNQQVRDPLRPHTPDINTASVCLGTRDTLQIEHQMWFTSALRLPRKA
jgi:hypothetical protein